MPPAQPRQHIRTGTSVGLWSAIRCRWDSQVACGQVEPQLTRGRRDSFARVRTMLNALLAFCALAAFSSLPPRFLPPHFPPAGFLGGRLPLCGLPRAGFGCARLLADGFFALGLRAAFALLFFFAGTLAPALRAS